MGKKNGSKGKRKTNISSNNRMDKVTDPKNKSTQCQQKMTETRSKNNSNQYNSLKGRQNNTDLGFDAVPLPVPRVDSKETNENDAGCAFSETDESKSVSETEDTKVVAGDETAIENSKTVLNTKDPEVADGEVTGADKSKSVLTAKNIKVVAGGETATENSNTVFKTKDPEVADGGVTGADKSKSVARAMNSEVVAGGETATENSNTVLKTKDPEVADEGVTEADKSKSVSRAKNSEVVAGGETATENFNIVFKTKDPDVADGGVTEADKSKSVSRAKNSEVEAGGETVTENSKTVLKRKNPDVVNRRITEADKSKPVLSSKNSKVVAGGESAREISKTVLKTKEPAVANGRVTESDKSKSVSRAKNSKVVTGGETETENSKSVLITKDPDVADVGETEADKSKSISRAKDSKVVAGGETTTENSKTVLKTKNPGVVDGRATEADKSKPVLSSKNSKMVAEGKTETAKNSKTVVKTKNSEGADGGVTEADKSKPVSRAKNSKVVARGEIATENSKTVLKTKDPEVADEGVTEADKSKSVSRAKNSKVLVGGETATENSNTVFKIKDFEVADGGVTETDKSKSVARAKNSEVVAGGETATENSNTVFKTKNPDVPDGGVTGADKSISVARAKNSEMVAGGETETENSKSFLITKDSDVADVGVTEADKSKSISRAKDGKVVAGGETLTGNSKVVLKIKNPDVVDGRVTEADKCKPVLSSKNSKMVAEGETETAKNSKTVLKTKDSEGADRGVTEADNSKPVSRAKNSKVVAGGETVTENSKTVLKTKDYEMADGGVTEADKSKSVSRAKNSEVVAGGETATENSNTVLKAKDPEVAVRGVEEAHKSKPVSRAKSSEMVAEGETEKSEPGLETKGTERITEGEAKIDDSEASSETKTEMVAGIEIDKSESNMENKEKKEVYKGETETNKSESGSETKDEVVTTGDTDFETIGAQEVAEEETGTEETESGSKTKGTEGIAEGETEIGKSTASTETKGEVVAGGETDKSESVLENKDAKEKEETGTDKSKSGSETKGTEGVAEGEREPNKSESVSETKGSEMVAELETEIGKSKSSSETKTKVVAGEEIAKYESDLENKDAEEIVEGETGTDTSESGLETKGPEMAAEGETETGQSEANSETKSEVVPGGQTDKSKLDLENKEVAERETGTDKSESGSEMVAKGETDIGKSESSSETKTEVVGGGVTDKSESVLKASYTVVAAGREAVKSESVLEKETEVVAGGATKTEIYKLTSEDEIEAEDWRETNTDKSALETKVTEVDDQSRVKNTLNEPVDVLISGIRNFLDNSNYNAEFKSRVEQKKTKVEENFEINSELQSTRQPISAGNKVHSKVKDTINEQIGVLTNETMNSPAKSPFNLATAHGKEQKKTNPDNFESTLKTQNTEMKPRNLSPIFDKFIRKVKDNLNELELIIETLNVHPEFDHTQNIVVETNKLYSLSRYLTGVKESLNELASIIETQNSVFDQERASGVEQVETKTENSFEAALETQDANVETDERFSNDNELQSETREHSFDGIEVQSPVLDNANGPVQSNEAMNSLDKSDYDSISLTGVEQENLKPDNPGSAVVEQVTGEEISELPLDRSGIHLQVEDNGNEMVDSPSNEAMNSPDKSDYDSISLTGVEQENLKPDNPGSAVIEQATGEEISELPLDRSGIHSQVGDNGNEMVDSPSNEAMNSPDKYDYDSISLTGVEQENLKPDNPGSAVIEQATCKEIGELLLDRNKIDSQVEDNGNEMVDFPSNEAMNSSDKSDYDSVSSTGVEQENLKPDNSVPTVIKQAMGEEIGELLLDRNKIDSQVETIVKEQVGVPINEWMNSYDIPDSNLLTTSRVERDETETEKNFESTSETHEHELSLVGNQEQSEAKCTVNEPVRMSPTVTHNFREDGNHNIPMPGAGGETTNKISLTQNKQMVQNTDNFQRNSISTFGEGELKMAKSEIISEKFSSNYIESHAGEYLSKRLKSFPNHVICSHCYENLMQDQNVIHLFHGSKLMCQSSRNMTLNANMNNESGAEMTLNGLSETNMESILLSETKNSVDASGVHIRHTKLSNSSFTVRNPMLDNVTEQMLKEANKKEEKLNYTNSAPNKDVSSPIFSKEQSKSIEHSLESAENVNQNLIQNEKVISKNHDSKEMSTNSDSVSLTNVDSQDTNPIDEKGTTFPNDSIAKSNVKRRNQSWFKKNKCKKPSKFRVRNSAHRMDCLLDKSDKSGTILEVKDTTTSKHGFNFSNTNAPDLNQGKVTKSKILNSTEVERKQICEEKSRDNYMQFGEGVKTKECSTFDLSPPDNLAVTTTLEEGQTLCLNSPERSPATNLLLPQSSAFQAFPKSGDVPDKKERFISHAASRIEISSIQTNQIASKKSIYFEKNRTTKDFMASKFYDWRQKKQVLSDSSSESSCSENDENNDDCSEPTIGSSPDIVKPTRNVLKLSASHQQKATIRSLNDSMQKQEFDQKRVEVVNNTGGFNFRLISDNLRLEISHNPSIVSQELSRKREEISTAESYPSTVIRNPDLEVASTNVLHQVDDPKYSETAESPPSAIKRKVVRKSKHRNVQNKSKFRGEHVEMQSSTQPHQSTPKKVLKQKEYGTPKSGDYQSKIKPTIPDSSHNDVIETDPSDSLAVKGSPIFFGQENRRLDAMAEIESVLDSLDNFHFSDSDERQLATKNEKEFCFQTKNIKMSYEPSSNLDNFKFCYKRSFSNSELQLISNNKK